MNSKAKSFIKNFSYTLGSNVISLLISTITVLILPKLIGVGEYGYWQLYLFYSSYVGFLHFGWNDGIYLKYGGRDYKQLDKNLFFSQFYMLVVVQIIISIVVYTISTIYFIDINKIFIFKMIALCLLTTNTKLMLLNILQSTNRIKEYAKTTLLDRLIYCCLIIILIISGVREYKVIIFADIIGRFISLLYAIYCCKDIVIRNISSFYFCIGEAIDNINVGMKLMFANIASMLIIGIVRFGIEWSWNIETFGKISLTLSASNLIMVFINAIGIVLFPILKRTNEEKLSNIYKIMRDFLMVILLGTLIIYFPAKVILSAWLPQYTESLKYMALVFPMCIFEGKMSLLINTYLKVLRKEKLMLTVNFISVGLSIVLTFINTIILKNLSLAITSIVFLLAFRCVITEIYLSKMLSILLYKDILLELTTTLIFVLTGWFLNTSIAILLYTTSYSIYIFIKYKDIRKTIANVKMLAKV